MGSGAVTQSFAEFLAAQMGEDVDERRAVLRGGRADEVGDLPEAIVVDVVQLRQAGDQQDGTVLGACSARWRERRLRGEPAGAPPSP